jgi:hypothetical protein
LSLKSTVPHSLTDSFWIPSDKNQNLSFGKKLTGPISCENLSNKCDCGYIGVDYFDCIVDAKSDTEECSIGKWWWR